MSDESDPLEELAKAIADGQSINWDDIERHLPADEATARRLRHLRMVADIAGLHGSQIDASASPHDDATTSLSQADRPPDVPARTPHPATDDDETREVAGDAPLRRWGHLLLLRKIGTGAFGDVYHAHDTWLDHPVALKLLRPDLASRRLSSRVLHEARKLARVRHPNVVSVHGADSHDGQIGFWMDLVQGDTLADLVETGRLSSGEATYIGQEVCLALAAVHQAKLIHRDVKAQNVMRASDGGRIILMDFGAGEFMDDVSVAMRGQGTPLYLAPEILDGGPASVASDIYSVGVLLYHLVTGEFPVRGQSVEELVSAHRRGERQRLRNARADLPDSFIAIVERAVDPDPLRRFASAGDMHSALAGESSAPLRVPSRRSATQPTALERVRRGALFIAALVLGTGLLGFIATRTFEIVLRIDPSFAAGPGTALRVGLEGLIPFVAHWLIAGAVLGVVLGIRQLFRTRINRLWTRLATRFAAPDPVTVATVVFLAGASCWIAITWAFGDVFGGLDRLRTAPSPATTDISILTPTARDIHKTHGQYSAYLSFALALAVWRLFPRLERRMTNPSPVRLLKWATIVVAYVAIVAVTLPRRVVWESFNEALFENRPALVIGESRTEVLLYLPEAVDRTHLRVPLGAPGLTRTGARRQLFAASPTTD